MKLLTRLIPLVFCLMTPGLVVAASGNGYFWLVRIMPNFRTLVQGLARVAIPEGATNAAADMHFYGLAPNNLAAIGTGPNPQVRRRWNIDNLMSLNWQALPRRRITASGEVTDHSTSTAENIQIDFSRIFNSIRPPLARRFFDSPFGPSLAFPIDFYEIPLNLKIKSGRILHTLENGIEIAPQGESSQLIAPMTPVHPSITAQIENSPLASAVNTALSGQGLSESSYNPTIANLFSTLTNEPQLLDNMHFIESLNSYIILSPSTNSVFSLVPHETLVQLGFIPGADSQAENHLNPDTWGK